MREKISIAAILIFTLICCKKDDPQPCTDNGLPCLTTEGKNTFGCYVDGETFVAHVHTTIGGPIAVSGSFNESNGLLKLQGTREDESENLEDIGFWVYASSGIGTYEMDVIGSVQSGYVDYSGQSCTYYHNINNKGIVNIVHLDLDENIISGTFNVDMINPDCSDTLIQITSGRFDFKY